TFTCPLGINSQPSSCTNGLCHSGSVRTKMDWQGNTRPSLSRTAVTPDPSPSTAVTPSAYTFTPNECNCCAWAASSSAPSSKQAEISSLNADNKLAKWNTAWPSPKITIC